MIQEITPDGLHLRVSAETLEGIGWRSGQRVSVRIDRSGITVRPVLPLEDRLVARALAYLDRCVGDATTVELPSRRSELWELPVFLSYADRRLGTLVFNEEGVLLVSESSSPEAMRQAACDVA